MSLKGTKPRRIYIYVRIVATYLFLSLKYFVRPPIDEVKCVISLFCRVAASVKKEGANRKDIIFRDIPQVQKGIGMKTLLYGPMDYAKTLEAAISCRGPGPARKNAEVVYQ